MLARNQQKGSIQGRCLIVGICDKQLAMLLAEGVKRNCASVEWITDCECQYIKRLNWRKYAHVYCSKDFYEHCFSRLNPVANIVDITIVMTDKSEILSLTLLSVPTSVKKKYFMPATHRFSNSVSL